MHFALYLLVFYLSFVFYDHLDYNENNIVCANCMAMPLKEEPNRGYSEVYNFLIK